MSASWFFRHQLSVPPFAACQRSVSVCPSCDVLLEDNERLLSDLHDALDRVVTQEDSARAIYDMAAEVAAQRERDAEVRGARWGLDVALDSRKWPVSKWTPEEVCRDAREQGEQ